MISLQLARLEAADSTCRSSSGQDAGRAGEGTRLITARAAARHCFNSANSARVRIRFPFRAYPGALAIPVPGLKIPAADDERFVASRVTSRNASDSPHSAA